MNASFVEQCLFQEDCDGLGAEIEEIHWPNDESERCSPPLHLNPDTVDDLMDRGVTSVFLTYRGHFPLDRVFRS